MTFTNSFIEEARRHAASRDELVDFLKKAGLSKIHCIQAFAQVTGVSLGQAKSDVHASPAWSASRTADELVHDGLIRSIS